MRLEDAIERHRGVIRTAEYPSLRSSISRMVSRGALIYAFPGVVMDSQSQDNHLTWIRAATAWQPNAIIAGAAAAKLTFSSEQRLSIVRIFTTARITDRGPIRFSRAVIPTDFVDYVGDIRVISAEATALTAGIDGDSEPGTTALRTGFTTPEAIANAAALWPMRPQRQLLAYVKTLSTNPWSVAEVEAHRMFRELGIRGWVGNPRLMIRGKAAYPDIALPAPKVAFEVNSYAHHSSKQDMERDSARLNLLVSAGWRVYSLTPNQIRNHPEETGAFVTSVVPRRWQHPLRTTMG